MDVQKQYDDTISSLNDTCRTRLAGLKFDLDKEKKMESAVKANAGKPKGYFKLP